VVFDDQHHLLIRAINQMKRYSTIALAAAVAFAAGCKDNPSVNPIDAPTVDALGSGLTRTSLQQLATGAFAQDRANATGFAYVLEAEIWARDAYRIDPSEPRYVQETLGGNPDPGSFAGGGAWAGYYTAERAENNVILALANAPASQFSTAEVNASKGLLRTLKALAEWRVIEYHDTVGATIQTDDAALVGAIRCKTAVLAYVAALLDSANTDLVAAGASTVLPFTVPSGFGAALAGRNYAVVSNLILFNRGLKGKVDFYRALDRTNPTPALFTTAIAELTQALGGAAAGAVPTANFNFGPYYQWVAGGSENTINPISDSKVGLNPLVKDSVLAGDTRASKIVARTALSQFGLATSITYVGAVASTANQIVPLGILRDEELVLLRAQAEIEAGQLANAILDVNDVRTNYGLAATTFATTAAGRTAVLYEKRYSLLFEGPMRLDDLREYKQLNITFHRAEQATDPFNAALPITRGELNARSLSVNPACTA
jgi:starch-binding outer membrane protein, SusD/RagB family